MDEYLKNMSGSWKGRGILFVMLLLLLMSNACHEGGHALAAWWSGDRRESIRRRATLNPIKHFHWFLTAVLPLLSMYFLGFLLGGARPVMLDRRNLSPGGLAIAAVAGPIGNFLCAGFLIAGLGFALDQRWINPADLAHDPWYRAIKPVVWYSLFLGLMNLIPFPPLDGSRIVQVFMPSRLREIWLRLTPVGIILVIVAGLWISGQLERFGLGPGHPEVFMAVERKTMRYVESMADFFGEIR